MTGFAAGFTPNILPGICAGFVGWRSTGRGLDGWRMLLWITEAAALKPPDPKFIELLKSFKQEFPMLRPHCALNKYRPHRKMQANDRWLLRRVKGDLLRHIESLQTLREP